MLVAVLLLVPQIKLTAVEEAEPIPGQVVVSDTYGASVRLVGNRLFVGSLEGASTKPGRIYVWERTGTTWTEAAQLVLSGVPSYRSLGDRIEETR